MDLASSLAVILLFARGGRGAKTSDQAPSSSPVGPGPMPHEGMPPVDTSAPAEHAAAAAQAATVTPAPSADTSTPASAPAPVLPWPQGPVPATLPSFPGPGWEPDLPVTPEVSSRATYWNGLLWDFASKTQRKPFVQENFGGQWITWAAAWHPDASGAPHKMMATEAWRVKLAPTITPGNVPAAVPAAAPPPVPTSAPPATPPTAAPAHEVTPVAAVAPLGAYPGPGAWQSNGAFIAHYQAALAALGYIGIDGKPLASDGKYGNNTAFAVKAFQGAHALPADGRVGPSTIPVINAALAAAQAH